MTQLPGGDFQEDIGPPIKPPKKPSNGGNGGAQLGTIRIERGLIAKTVDETEEALIRSHAHVFVRAGAHELVEPIFTQVDAPDGEKTITSVLRQLPETKLAYVLNREVTRFQAKSKQKDKWCYVDPPKEIVKTLLQKGQWRIPAIVGVINSPTIRPDGSILDSPGYDPDTQLFYRPDSSLQVPITDRPTREDALAAKESLKDLLVNFPFVGPIDRAVALAMLMTPILRGAFSVAPLNFIRAHQARTGKTYLLNTVSTLATGRECPVCTWTDDKAENEKRLGAMIMEGVPIIGLDNCSIDLGGNLLCQITEQRLVRTRILGLSKMPIVQWCGTVFADGNNVSVVGEVAPRTLQCNLDAKSEDPGSRKFSFNPIDRILADRGRYIANVLTIVRAHFVAGEPQKFSPWASYDGYSRFVRAPLIWLGEPDVRASMENVRASDPKEIARKGLIILWRKHLVLDQDYSAQQIIDEVSKSSEACREGVPYVLREFREFLLDQCPMRNNRREIDSIRLGIWLSRIVGQVVNLSSVEGAEVAYRIVKGPNQNGSGRYRLTSQF
jgi:putative DNA primase/helicase